MKKQRLIALMCTGIILSTSLTACSNSSDFTNDETSNKEKYIVMKEDDVNILHQGNNTLIPSTDINGNTTIKYRYTSDCGKSYISQIPLYKIYEELHQEDSYDDTCDQCFGK